MRARRLKIWVNTSREDLHTKSASDAVFWVDVHHLSDKAVTICPNGLSTMLVDMIGSTSLCGHVVDLMKSGGHTYGENNPIVLMSHLSLPLVPVLEGGSSE